jgi:outer membrane protein assembly factor BamA
MRCALFGAALAGQVLLAAPSAFAQAAEAANAGDTKKGDSKSKHGGPKEGGSATSEEPEEKSDTEFTALPVVGGDSDVGIGGGVITSLARVEPDLDPYLWRIEAVGMLTLKPSDGYSIRYVDTYLMLSLPHIIRDRLGLSVRVSYTKESDLSYYGIGNASELGAGLDENDPYYAFDWTHPKLETFIEYEIGKGFELLAGVAYNHNQLDVPPDGKLAEDSQSDDADLRQLTRIVPEYGVAVGSIGLNWDTRDDEVAPERGHYHAIRLDLAPGYGSELPYTWARGNLVLRQYVPLISHRLIFAARVMADALFGEPPFYELARFDNTFAIGGGRGVRGIPAPRYYGMLKLLGNFELRVKVLTFDLFDKPHELGIVGFTDMGRVVADWDSLSELDGSGLGMKVAYGGGLRVRAGQSFVLRLDVAGSKQEGSVSAYLAAGHLF